MNKLLLGMLAVSIVTAAAVAQETKPASTQPAAKKTAAKDGKPVIMLIQKGTEPFYSLARKYLPGKYRITIWSEYSAVKKSTNRNERSTTIKVRNVFTLEASSVDAKGNQTLTITLEEISDKRDGEAEVTASRSEQDTAKEPVDDDAGNPDVDETDQPHKNIDRRRESMQERLNAAVDAPPTVMTIDANGKVVSENDPLALPQPMSMIGSIYSGMDVSHLFPEIGVGGSFRMEKNSKIFGEVPTCESSVITLQSVQTFNGDSVATLKLQTTYTMAPADESADKDDRKRSPKDIRVSGTSDATMTFNLTKSNVTKNVSDCKLEFVLSERGNEMNMTMQSKSSLEIEILK